MVHSYNTIFKIQNDFFFFIKLLFLKIIFFNSFFFFSFYLKFLRLIVIDLLSLQTTISKKKYFIGLINLL